MADQPLLPQDRYIARMLGISDDEMRRFKMEVARIAAEHPPQGPTAGAIGGFFATFLVNLLIGVGLTVIASLLLPKPRERGQLTTTNRQGANLTSPNMLASTYGFDAVQDIAPLGDPIPLVFARREKLDGQWYGGVRVNMPLLWSQMWSLGGSQMLKAVFLVSEGQISASSVDPFGFAIGNNTLGAYQYNSDARRISIYYAFDGGRMSTANFLAGGSPARDVGASGSYASDIYRVQPANAGLSQDFSGTTKPSTSTQFGLYQPIANGLGYRENPQIRPLVTLATYGEKNDTYTARDDASSLAQAWKQKYVYSSKTGIISANGDTTPARIKAVSVGQEIVLMLSSKADCFEAWPPQLWGDNGPSADGTLSRIRFDAANTNNEPGSAKGDETLLSVATAVAGRQRQYDSSLVEGEVYMIGTALCILISRANFNNGSDTGPFISEADYGSGAADGVYSTVRSIRAVFRVIRAGSVGITGQGLIDKRFLLGGDNRPRLGAPIATSASRIWFFNNAIANNSASPGGADSLTEGNIGRRHYTASNFPQIYKVAIASAVLNRPARLYEIGIASRVGMQIRGLCNFADVPSMGDSQPAIKGSATGLLGNPYTGYTSGGQFVQWPNPPNASNPIGNTNIDIWRVGTFEVPTTIVAQGQTGGQQTRNGSGLTLIITIAPGGTSFGYGYITSIVLGSLGNADYYPGAVVEVPNSAIASLVEPAVVTSTGFPASGWASENRVRAQVDATFDTLPVPVSGEPGYFVINNRAAWSFEGIKITRNLANSIYQSGTVSASETRYSCFRVFVRKDRADNATWYSTRANVFCVAGTQSDVTIYNFLRFLMDEEAQWETRFEPVTSWEVRNGHPIYGTLTIWMLEANNSSGNSVLNQVDLRSDGGADIGTVWIKGSQLNVPPSDYGLPKLLPRQEIGLSWTELRDLSYFTANRDFGAAPGNGTYTDHWGRFAEMFVYDEITTSAMEGPEHEISYVNVITENVSVPQYDNMALVGLNIRSGREWQQFTQFSIYLNGGMNVNRIYEGGTGPSHLFPEILHHYMLDTRYGLGREISAQMIDLPSFQEAAQWCFDNRLFFDGVKVANQNWRQWAADVAAAHVLLFIEVGGKFYLKPALPPAPVTISGLFTAGNCVSIDFESADAEARVPVTLSVKYREERCEDSTNDAYGLFPTPRELLISYDPWGEGQIESLDVSDFCTSRQHAILAARYVIAQRYYADHSVKIKTTYEGLTSSIRPGDYIRVQVDKVLYSKGVSGFIDENGIVQSATPLPAGENQVFFWNGDPQSEVELLTLLVSEEGAASLPQGVFTLARSQTDVNTYQIDSIQPSEEGFEISAIHTPTDASGRLLAEADWLNDAAWTVQE